MSEYVEKTPDPEAYYLLGYSLYKQRKFREAEEYFAQTYLIDPEFKPELHKFEKLPRGIKVPKGIVSRPKEVSKAIAKTEAKPSPEAKPVPEAKPSPEAKIKPKAQAEKKEPAKPIGVITKKDFKAAFPPPVWWKEVSAPVKIRKYNDLDTYWQDKKRSDKQFFKAAYQAILDNPKNNDIVVNAIYLMSSADPSYPHMKALQEFALERYFSYKRPLRGYAGKEGDTIAGIAESLTKTYNGERGFDKTVALVEKLLTDREPEINDQMLELLHVEYATALDGMGRTQEAVAVLNKAIEKYNGDWESTLRGLLQNYEAKLALKKPARGKGLFAKPAFLTAVLAASGIVVVAIALALYVFYSLCLFLIARKLNVAAAWTAFVPILQIWPIVGSAGKPWWWILLLFVPVVNVFIAIYLWMLISENLGRSKWLGLLMLLPLINLILLGLFAFSKSATGGTSFTPPPDEFGGPGAFGQKDEFGQKEEFGGFEGFGGDESQEKKEEDF